jgi:hypothetical protein
MKTRLLLLLIASTAFASQVQITCCTPVLQPDTLSFAERAFTDFGVSENEQGTLIELDLGDGLIEYTLEPEPWTGEPYVPMYDEPMPHVPIVATPEPTMAFVVGFIVGFLLVMFFTRKS